jgi:CheY-like chemotaxis protein
MSDQAFRILLGDTHPESRAVLEAICQEQEWEFTAVDSSSQLLRLLRAKQDFSLVMVDPTLSGADPDVAKTIKASAQSGTVPVMFVLHRGVGAPKGTPADGSIEIDHAGPARVLAAMREAISGAGAAQQEDPRPAEESPAPPAVAVVPPSLSVVHSAPGTRILVADTAMTTGSEDAQPAAEASRVAVPASVGRGSGGRTVRILVADTVVTTRTVLEPLCERHGWELIAVESGFQVLRVVRDTAVDLVLINPHVQAAGVSGVDIARTIKAAAQFRKIPVLFILHAGTVAPAGAKVDGAVEVDTWPAARLGSALSTAIKQAGGAVDAAAPGGAAPAQGLPVEQLAQLREVLLAEVRRTSEAALKAFAQTEGRAIAEEAVRRSAATKAGGQAEQMASIAREAIGDTITRLERLETAVAAMEGAIVAARQAAETAARAKAPGIEPSAAREAMKTAVREHLVGEGRTVVEHAIGALAREIVPPLAERLVRQQLERLPSPTAAVDQLLPQLKEQILREGRSRVEDSVAALAREIVPPLAERLVRQQLERLPNPTAAIDQLLPQLKEQILREGRSRVEESVAALAREIVPPLAERLVRQQLERLPSPTAAVNELLPQLKEQILREGRSRVEESVAALTREAVPALVERLVRQQLERLPNPAAAVDQLLPQLKEQILREGRSRVEESVAALAREIVPPLAERLVRQQLERLPNPTAAVDQLLRQIQAQVLTEARRIADAGTKEQVEGIGAAVRQQLDAYTDEAVRALAREIVPAVAERLISNEIARLREQYKLD